MNGNVYIADADSSIQWSKLYALGKNTTGGNGTADFSDADAALGLTTAEDNITALYSSDGGTTAKKTSSYNLFKRNIAGVPEDESTNNTNWSFKIRK